jgi:hypothetical protein
MKRIFLIAVGLVILFGITLTVQPLKAQVYGDFDTIRIIYNTPYQELDNSKNIIPATSFGLPPNWSVDLDDGYSNPTGIDIGFPFEFNGNVYTKVWVCINGFLTFTPPPFYPAKQPKGLFVSNVSYPINVIAPFWGDHRFRAAAEQLNGYMPSEISYKYDAANGVFTVQWKNLNINDQTVPSSVGNFQVKIYKSTDPLSGQGNIEFCYGQIGGNIYNTGTLVVTKGASVGLKGESNDFMNALRFQKADGSYNPVAVRQDDSTLTNEWTPSGGNEKRIRFNANIRYNIDMWWGDGDADMSKGFGRKHYNLDQSRFVTVNDARVIMRSVATNVPLDSVRRRAAFHADVNHNGRYWWPTTTTMETIPWRDSFEGDNLPTQVNTIKRVFFKANEYDAALILHYLSARIPSLPWLLDTIPQYGKIAASDVASNIKFGTSQKVSGNVFTVPVYLNGTVNGPLGVAFNINAVVNDVKTIENDNAQLITEFDGNNVILTGTGNYDNMSPIAYITFTTTNNDLKVSNVRFNDKEVEPINVSLSSVEAGIDNGMLLQNSPNPFNATTLISVNVEKANNYTLAIYDINGKRIKNIANELMNPGVRNYIWDGTNEANEIVESGVYIYRLVGDNVSLSKKLVFNK